ncbi:IS3 family transposase, partial [Acetobacter oeni]
SDLPSDKITLPRRSSTVHAKRCLAYFPHDGLSFFSSLKRERIRRRTYKTRQEARQDVFDYIEMFYNPVRKQVRKGMLSAVQFEQQQTLNAQGV